MDELRRLFGPLVVPSGAASTLIYTAPADRRVVIRDLQACVTSGAKRTLKLGIGGIADAQLLYAAMEIASAGAFQRTGQITLEAGETLHAQADAAGMTITGFGVREVI